ncbi:MAG: hypothetical protein ACREOF_05115 [Gemmatimonadales bacterium]
MNRPPHLLARGRVWMLPVLVIVLLAGHGVILYYMSSHVILSAAVLSGAIILLMIKHVGLLGLLYALFRRRRSGHRP